MFFPRSDLALETALTLSPDSREGIAVREHRHGCITLTCVTIQTPQAAKRMNKPCGNYITVQTPPLWNSLLDPQQEIDAVADCIRHFLPKNGVVLIVGLGNRSITPDALGPMVAERIIATRHLGASLAEQLGLSSLRKTAAIAPGVMGQTGIETGEIVRSVVSFLKPSAVIAVDALAAQDYKRLGKTIQISDSGISPGSGVQNSRKELSQTTLGVPVLSVGVPTVIDGASLARSLSENDIDCPDCTKAGSAMVTPREVDRMIGHSAKFIAFAVNKALYPQLRLEEISFLCS